MKLIALLTLSFMSVFAQAQEQDLELAGERWVAGHKGYLCEAFGDYVSVPTSHSKMNFTVERLSTDRTLDNVLIVATFEEEGVTCRYSSLLFADNDKGTVELLQSKAYSPTLESNCLVGKQILDEQLQFNDYLYWGHPHHVTIMIPENSANSICNNGTGLIGVDFTLTRVIR